MDIKVIFLDVDGVLNSQDDLMIYREKNNITGSILYDAVEDRALNLLKEIVENTGAKIVISSSWQTEYDDKEDNPDANLYNKLKYRLKDYDMEIYDVTPFIRKTDTHRGDEIRAWLSKNPVQNFVILDDDSDMREFLHTEHFIKTTYKHGLTEELKNKAITVLNERKGMII